MEEAAQGLSIGVLAVQGAFIEHERRLRALGARCFEVRTDADCLLPMDGLVLPGGESTAQGRILRDEGMIGLLKERIMGGLPVLATCAGLILLAERIDEPPEPSWFATMPLTVARNAYGRQLDSFAIEAPFADRGLIPMTFIRAPRIEGCSEAVSVLATSGGMPVAVRLGWQLALSFHPELGESTVVHRYFLGMAAAAKGGR